MKTKNILIILLAAIIGLIIGYMLPGGGITADQGAAALRSDALNTSLVQTQTADLALPPPPTSTDMHLCIWYSINGTVHMQYTTGLGCFLRAGSQLN